VLKLFIQNPKYNPRENWFLTVKVNTVVNEIEHPFATCEISNNEEETEFIGTLTYKGNVNGILKGSSFDSVRNQFAVICNLMDNEGAMLRRGSIMLGYHNGVLKGDVLLPDGEIIGYWEMEELDEWSTFIPEGQTEFRLSGMSAWLLQDAIADWLESKNSP